MSFVRLLVSAIVLSLSPIAASAQDDSCTLLYFIQPGDTLPSIAKLAYGKGDYQLIFSRNYGRIKKVNDLRVGEVLLIPCAFGIKPSFSQVLSQPPEESPTTGETETEVATTSEPSAASQAQAANEGPEPQNVVATAAPATRVTSQVESLKMLTASGFAPYSDQSLRGGGMATELATRSLEILGIKDKSRIVFINDRESHLQDLLIDGSFDLGFPWFRPSCEYIDKLEQLSPQDAWLCKNFIFSEPFYELVYGYFVRKGEYAASRVSFDDFADARICRPAGASVLDLAVNGIEDGVATYVRPDTLAQCFELLLDGEVDAISGEAFEAENQMAAMGIYDDVEELANLSILQSVHAIAPLGKPGADAAIQSLNTGLIDLKINGEWFRIVGRHLVQN